MIPQQPKTPQNQKMIMEKSLGRERLPKKGCSAFIKKKNDYYFEIPAKLLNRDMLIVNKLTKVPAVINKSGINKGINYQTELVRFEWNKDEIKFLSGKYSPNLNIRKAMPSVNRSTENYISPLMTSCSK